jgi:hypothetical protein
MANTLEQEKRFEELYEKAVRRYLDKTDFNPTDWLEPKEQEEYLELMGELE